MINVTTARAPSVEDERVTKYLILGFSRIPLGKDDYQAFTSWINATKSRFIKTDDSFMLQSNGSVMSNAYICSITCRMTTWRKFEAALNHDKIKILGDEPTMHEISTKAMDHVNKMLDSLRG